MVLVRLPQALLLLAPFLLLSLVVLLAGLGLDS
jgi:hypothetical protein